MPMEVPAGTVLLGANAYLFQSPAGAGVTDCFIVGHGGTPHGKDYRFKVPAGCSVKFFATAGNAHVMNHGPVAGFRAIAGQNGGAAPPIDARDQFAGGADCRDYILGKAIGRHYKAEPDAHTYVGINSTLNALAGLHAGLQWLPHYVTVRHRTSWFRDTNIWLSRLIKLARAHNPAIVNFYCSHCRGYVRGDDEASLVKSAGAQG